MIKENRWLINDIDCGWVDRGANDGNSNGRTGMEEWWEIRGIYMLGRCNGSLVNGSQYYVRTLGGSR